MNHAASAIQTQSSRMSAADFVAAAIVIPVRPAKNPSQVARLEVPDEHLARVDSLKRHVAAGMKALGAPDMSAQLVSRYLEMPLVEHLWYLMLPSGKVVVLVKDEIFQRLPEREIVEQVHKREVDAAIMRGETVPQDIIHYYRHKPTQALAPAGY